MPTGLAAAAQAKFTVPSAENARSATGAPGAPGGAVLERFPEAVESTAEKALGTEFRLTACTRKKYCAPGISVKNVAEVARVADESVSEKKLSEDTCATYTVSDGLFPPDQVNTPLVMYTALATGRVGTAASVAVACVAVKAVAAPSMFTARTRKK